MPTIPDALREAAQRGTLIPFIGAGASRLAGCPNWDDFADGALRFFVDSGKISFAQLSQLSGLRPRVKLSLALELEREHTTQIPFRTLLHPRSRESHDEGRRLYAALSRLGSAFVTTNYDEWLDDKLPEPRLSLADITDASADSGATPRSVLFKSDDLLAVNLNKPDTVLHLHGSVKEPHGMILTTPQYVSHYANDRRLRAGDRENPVLTFLEDLFRDKTVLFVGYGMDELEILEYVILKSKGSRSEREQVGHFLLQGFYSHQRELMLGLRRYYRSCGIELLPFLMDQKDHAQLMDVLEALAAALPATKVAVLQEFQEMERWLDG